MPKKYNHDWDALIEEQRQSGINMKLFCINNDVPYSAFKNHLYRSRKDKGISFLPVEQEKQKDTTIKVNGSELTLATDIDDLFLQRILKALTS